MRRGKADYIQIGNNALSTAPNRPKTSGMIRGPARCGSHGLINQRLAERLVRVVGLEPTLLAETDFESVASTIPPHPPTQLPLVAINRTD